MKKIGLAALFCCFVVSFAAAQEDSKVFYMMNIQGEKCSAEVMVNGIPVFTENYSGKGSSKTNMNSSIFKSGMQKVSVSVKPSSGEKAFHPESSFVIEINVADSGWKTISTEKHEIFSAAKNGTDLPSVNKEITFNAKVPYEIKDLETSSDLSKNPEIKEILTKAYNNFINAVEKKDFATVEKLLAKENEIWAKALYLSDDQVKEGMDGTKSALIDNAVAIPKVPENAVVKIYYNGKLAKLQNPDGSNILMFKYKEGRGQIEFNYLFYMPEGSSEAVIF